MLVLESFTMGADLIVQRASDIAVSNGRERPLIIDFLQAMISQEFSRNLIEKMFPGKKINLSSLEKTNPQDEILCWKEYIELCFDYARRDASMKILPRHLILALFHSSTFFSFIFPK